MQNELDELPTIRWQVKVSPSMTRQEQLRRYQDATGVDAVKRQVKLRREELARQRQR